MTAQTTFKLFGIFGCPLSHTLSPAMQEAAFEKAGLKAFYAVFELEPASFKKAFGKIRHFVLDGFNVTVPYKQTVIPFLDGLTPEAQAIGAVNTVFKKNGEWIGANTDVYGFLKSLQADASFRPSGKTVLVFGAGGAARALLYGLADSGARQILISNRHRDRAEKLAKDFKKRFPKTSFRVILEKEIKQALEAANLVVNATSLGLNVSDSEVVKASWIPKAGSKKKLFCDLIYHRPKTSFLKAAAQKGHSVLGGAGMLLYQGSRAFEYWTGKKAPVSIMQRTLQAQLKNRKTH